MIYHYSFAFVMIGENMSEKISVGKREILNVSQPLEIIQIDHTRLPIILLDGLSKEQIGQPWLTLAIDTYSQMIAGYYLSFDQPSETSVCKCVIHAILPKDDWLQLHGINAKWNVFGLMKAVHTPYNFLSAKFKDACQTHGINIKIPSPLNPQNVTYAERFFWNLNKAIDHLPDATLTLADLDAYLATYICTVYHEQVHSSLGMSPSQKWNEGILESDASEKQRLLENSEHWQRLILDFLPSESETILSIGEIH
jgi:putative transposase